MYTIKLKQRILLLAVAFISIVLACCTKTDTDIPQPATGRVEDASHLTVLQTKQFFEYFTAKRNAKTKAAYEYLNRLVVGDFTPNWDNAVASNDGIIGSVDVPIESQMKYIALRQHHEGEITFTSRIPLYQKLVFVKNDTLNSIFPYLLSLIPDKDFYINHREEDIAGNFINLGNKGGFSGLAIYTTPHTGYLIRASRFENGNYVDGAFVLDPHNPFGENALKAESFLKDIIMIRVNKTMTKSDDEGDDIWDLGWLDGTKVTAKAPTKDDVIWTEEEEQADDSQTDPGGGSGNSSSTGDSESEGEKVSEEAKLITRTLICDTTMSDKMYRITERVIDTLYKDCRGKALLENIVGLLGEDEYIKVRYIPGRTSSFNIQTKELKIANQSGHFSYKFFHELNHYYQHENYEECSNLNLEIEAWYSTLNFVKKQNWYMFDEEYSDKYDENIIVQAMDGLHKFIDHNGNLLPSKREEELKSYIETDVVPAFRGILPYSNAVQYPFNAFQSGLENFNGIRTLSANC